MRGRRTALWIGGTALAAGAVAGATLSGQPASGLPVIDVTLGGATVRAEVAATRKDRARGLMYRESLGRDEGMLFVYPDARPLSFWMRNTLVPLDIAYLGDDRKVVRVDSMRPLTDDGHPSGVPARYAIEVNRGWLAAHGVREGESVAFELPGGMIAQED